MNRDYRHATLIDDDTNIDRVVGDDILNGIEFGLAGVDRANNRDSPSQIALLDGAAAFRFKIM